MPRLGHAGLEIKRIGAIQKLKADCCELARNALYYYPPVSFRAATISCRSSDMLVCDAIQKLNADR
jgi:hypothetical protein